MTYIHSKGIIHRDLKLENIILKGPNSYKDLRIIDFGLSYIKGEKKMLFEICGTPGYIAPEIINLKKKRMYDEKCDIYSLGIILYMLLTGESVFSAVGQK